MIVKFNLGVAHIISGVVGICINIIPCDVIIVLWELHKRELMSCLLVHEEAENLPDCVCVVRVHVAVQVENERRIGYL